MKIKTSNCKPLLLAKTAGRKAKLKTAVDISDIAATAKANSVCAKLQMVYVDPATLQPANRRVRKSSSSAIKAVARAIATNGFITPIIIADNVIIDGHVRWEAAKCLDLPEVSVIDVSHLSSAHRELVKVGLNRTPELGEWDVEMLRDSIMEIELAGLEIITTGFSLAELDVIKLDPSPTAEAGLNDVPALAETVVSMIGDCWQLGTHRLLCGSATDAISYATLLGDEKVTLVLTDPPYNVKIGGNVSGLGKTKHGEFVQATGEMTSDEFSTFLKDVLANMRAHMIHAAVAMAFMDWRSITVLTTAGEAAGFSLINMAVWDKQRGGMGGLYRSGHELVAVFCNGATTPAVNNVKLGANGRDRTNVWSYPGATTPGSSAAKALSLHPTPKPVELLVDAMLDVSQHGDIVLDPFMGSGSAIIAGDECGRAVRGIELDPKYVDCAVRRWEQLLGMEAVLIATGQTFAQVAAERGATI